jgi:tungstate transport system permease protein
MHLIEAIRDAFSLLFSGDPALWQIIWVSLKTSTVALLIATPGAIVAGYAIAAYQFRGRRIAIWLTQASLSLPTVMIGLLLYLMLSRQGPLGSVHWLFSQPGVIAGQAQASTRTTAAFGPR